MQVRSMHDPSVFLLEGGCDAARGATLGNENNPPWQRPPRRLHELGYVSGRNFALRDDHVADLHTVPRGTMDETADVGEDGGTPIVEDYGSVDGRFSGKIVKVVIAISEAPKAATTAAKPAAAVAPTK
jgi:hypothetical protein